MSTRVDRSIDEDATPSGSPALDIDAALIRSRLLSRMFAEGETPRIGRFTVLRKLGEGGMGRVYACQDEHLDRELAVKLLRRQGDEAARLRLTREAQSLARLSHPNVVQIYEVGEHEGELYLAMELIAGHDLGAHLDAHPELRWRARLELALAAGRGLAAAHAAGLVHRDIKPSNVLVADDGRVCVVDFGLARGLHMGTTETASEDSAASPSTNLIEQGMTETGSVLGTPHYMAPEQYHGRGYGPAGDQFGYCVLVHELLYGCRPFRARSFEELREAICSGRIEPPPAAQGVPRGVRAVLLRGLAVEPEARWPDLPTLLEQLQRAAAAPRRRLLGIASVLGLVASMSAGALLFTDESEQCAVGPEALEQVWGHDRRAQLRSSWAEAGLEATDGAGLATIEASLDAWVESWLAVQRQACEATRDGLASATMLDQRSACLARARNGAAAMISVLLDAEGVTLLRSAELLEELPSPAPCAGEDPLDARYPLPQAPEARARVEAGYERIAEALALASTGHMREAEARAASFGAAVDYPPLEIELHALPGRLALRQGLLVDGIETVATAAREAEALHLDELAADLRVELTRRAVRVWGQPERERWLLAEAEASVARIGRPDDPRAVELLIARGNLEEDAGVYEAALATYRSAYEQAQAIGQRSLAERTRRNVGHALWMLARFDEAVVELEAARANAEARWGPRSPAVADAEYDLGGLELQRGRAEQAETHFAKARELYADIYGPQSPPVSRVDNHLAILAVFEGQFDRAAELLDAVIEVRKRQPERWPQALADTYEALGAVRFYQHDYPASISAYERSLELRRSVLAADHPLIANLYGNIGESRVALGEYEAAELAFARALEIYERSLPADHPDLALPYKGRGQAKLARGRYAEARADLERALELQRSNLGEPLELADVERSLAMTLVELGETARARELASSARQRYVDLQLLARADELTRWLEGHE